jgi:tetratricopeptide (TPR) repeat protein
MSVSEQAARLYGLRRYQEVLRFASATLRRHPRDARLWNVSAAAALALGLSDDAERFWKVAVANAPDYAEAHYNLGVLQFQRGHLPAAAHSFSRVVLLSPAHAAAMNNLGAVLVKLRRFAEAAVLLQRSVALDPANPQAFNNLGLALIELGRIPEARASLAQAIRLKPDFSQALTSSATLSTEAGDQHAAEQLLDAAIAADPGNGAAFLGRALLARAVEGAPWIERLRGAYQRRARLPREDATDLNFAMGKVCEDLGEFDAAFQAYAEGNRLHHAAHPFDEQADQELVAAMIEGFGADLYAADPPGGNPDSMPPDPRVPIFIVGMPRSGTSLVEQILSSHPEVHGAGELTTLDELLGPAPIRVPARAQRQPWLETLRALGGEYRARVWKAGVEAQFVVDKMPENYRYLGLLPLMIPNARIIHVRRDPLDTCFSCYATPFALGHEYSFDLGTLGRRYLRYQRIMDHWSAVLPPGRILEVRYEALVADPEHETRRMLTGIGLPWNDRCLKFYENRRAVRTASRAQVRQPIYTSALARWKRFERHLEPLRELLAPLDTVTLSTVSPTTNPAVQVLAPRTDTPAVREAVT